MKNKIVCMPMRSGEEAQIIDIVLSVFYEFVAPEYSDEGIAEFHTYANTEALVSRSRSNHFTLLAKNNGRLIGIIEIRGYNHVSMLFVEKYFQKMGVGKMLLEHAIDVCLKHRAALRKLTINSSPNSVSAYEKIGFIPDITEQCVNGIRFIPMSLTLQRRSGS